MQSIADLLEDQVKDLYSAENQLIKALPAVIRKAEDPALKEGLTAHLEETRAHAARIAEIAVLLEIKPGGKKCVAMEGLIEEGKEVIEEEGRSPVIDLGLIAACLRIEAYEIAAYSFAAEIARKVGNEAVAQLFETTLEDERNASDTLQETSTGIEPESSEDEEGTASGSGSPKTTAQAGGRTGRSSASSAGSVKRPRVSKDGAMGRARAVRARN